MLSQADKSDFEISVTTALRILSDTDDEIVYVVTKEKGIAVNAVVMVRGRGLTFQIIDFIATLMNKLDKAKAKVKK